METDLKQIKETSLMLLYLPIDTDERIPFICHHPFISSTHICINSNIVDVTKPNGLEKALEFYSENIKKAKNLWSIISLVNTPYLGIVFKMISKYLGQADYQELLAYVWMSEEYPNYDINVSQKDWIRLWRKVEPTNIDFLDDEFTVYRGLMRNASYKALSWTLDRNVAKWFSNRFNNEGKIYKATCKKKDVLAYVPNRNEKEIVVDWRKLINIQEDKELI